MASGPSWSSYALCSSVFWGSRLIHAHHNTRNLTTGFQYVNLSYINSYETSLFISKFPPFVLSKVGFVTVHKCQGQKVALSSSDRESQDDPSDSDFVAFAKWMYRNRWHTIKVKKKMNLNKGKLWRVKNGMHDMFREIILLFSTSGGSHWIISESRGTCVTMPQVSNGLGCERAAVKGKFPQKEHISSRDICQETQRERVRIEKNGEVMVEGKKIATVVWLSAVSNVLFKSFHFILLYVCALLKEVHICTDTIIFLKDNAT